MTTHITHIREFTTEFLRFNSPRADIVKLNDASTILLSATNTIKSENNLTDLQARIGLRSDFNSETSRAIKERCPWVPAPTCNPNLQFRSFDGSCNNLKDPNMGRTGTPYQRILLPEYAKVFINIFIKYYEIFLTGTLGIPGPSP